MAKVILVGTSHISGESMKKVHSVIEREQPDCVAIELDPIRYQMLLSRAKQRPTFSLGFTHFFLSFIQQNLGKRTGVLPGSEMLEAVRAARKVDARIVLIDKDIREILGDISRISVLEKIKLFGALVLGLVSSPFSKEKIDISKVPDERLIREAMVMMRKKLPQFYKILVSDRNRYMAKWIINLSRDHKKIVVVVGAGHENGLKKLLKPRKVR